MTDVSISGTGKVGTSLTATPPDWDSGPRATTYQWQRDGLNIGGADHGDVRRHGQRRRQGTDGQGHRHAGRLRPGRVGEQHVTGLLGDAPNATTDVSISGINNKVGTTLTLTAPTWNTTA